MDDGHQHIYDEDGDCLVCGHDLFSPDPGVLWPPDSDGIWPGTFPVAQIRRFPTASHGMPF